MNIILRLLRLDASIERTMEGVSSGRRLGLVLVLFCVVRCYSCSAGGSGVVYVPLKIAEVPITAL